MKLFLRISLFVVLLSAAFACNKKPEHYVRIYNSTSHVLSVRIDNVIEIESLPINEYSKYVLVEEGTHSIGGDYQGDFAVDGKGEHYWSLSVFPEEFSLQLDKSE